MLFSDIDAIIIRSLNFRLNLNYFPTSQLIKKASLNVMKRTITFRDAYIYKKEVKFVYQPQYLFQYTCVCTSPKLDIKTY